MLALVSVYGIQVSSSDWYCWFEVRRFPLRRWMGQVTYHLLHGDTQDVDPIRNVVYQHAKLKGCWSSLIYTNLRCKESEAYRDVFPSWNAWRNEKKKVNQVIPLWLLPENNIYV